MNDVSSIISQLEQQKAAIDRAIAALREVGPTGPRPGRPRKIQGAELLKNGRKRRRMTAEGRARIAEAAKKMWAAKRASGSVKKSATKKARGKKAAAKTVATAS